MQCCKVSKQNQLAGSTHKIPQCNNFSRGTIIVSLPQIARSSEVFILFSPKLREVSDKKYLYNEIIRSQTFLEIGTSKHILGTSGTSPKSRTIPENLGKIGRSDYIQNIRKLTQNIQKIKVFMTAGACKLIFLWLISTLRLRQFG